MSGPPPSLGFGLERIGLLALAHRRAAWTLLAIAAGLLLLGLTRLSFDEELRKVFRGDTEAYRTYVAATENFTDPENEVLVLVEGAGIAAPGNFSRLQDFQFELQLADGVEGVFSLFSLREPPDAEGNMPTLVRDPADGLSPELIARIRAHPLLGDKTLSADATAMLFVVTPAIAKAPLSVHRVLHARIAALAEEMLGGTGLKVTVTGFPVIRARIVDLLVRDQKVLNAAGAAIGLLLSLAIFGSLSAAVLTAAPAIAAGLAVVGVMGLFGVKITIMSNVVPALIMILGYADAMHLNAALRRNLGDGRPVEAAERLALTEIGPACMLTALTTSVAFLSLTVSDVEIVRSFGWTGAFATILGSACVLSVHALLAPLLARRWGGAGGARPAPLDRMAGPSAAIAGFAGRHAMRISALALILFAALGAMHLSVPPEHSVREHLGPNNPVYAAFGRIDRRLGGAFPVEIVVPLGGQEATAPQALARIGAVHRAAAGVEGAGTPLSLWSLKEWVGAADPPEVNRRLDELLSRLSATDRSRFIGRTGDALVALTIREQPTRATRPLVDRIELAARRAGGAGVVATGATVLTARESDRTIANLNYSLAFAVIAGLALMALAFRDVRFGAVAFLPNALPILATGSLLFLLGTGMQFTSVIGLTVAFGIAVDDTIHFLNGYRQLGGDGNGVAGRLGWVARRIGPVLMATTIVIVAGLTTTLTSGLATINLFGKLVMITLASALVGVLLFLPALMAGPARSWFDPKPQPEAARGGEAGPSRGS